MNASSTDQSGIKKESRKTQSVDLISLCFKLEVKTLLEMNSLVLVYVVVL